MRLICFSLFFLMALMGASMYKQGAAEQDSAKRVQRYYIVQLEEFLQTVRKLKNAEQKQYTEEELIPLFLTSRNSFKRAEFLLCYVDNNETRRINGANITVNNYTYLTPYDDIPPHGLQVIEDLLYHPGENTRSELRNEILLLEDLIVTVIERMKKQPVAAAREYNLIVWDAIRYELFRIETLGITGFDVPDSQHSLPECREALSSLKKVIGFYKSQYADIGKSRLLIEGNRLMDASVAYLRSNEHDFVAFDRLDFMKNYLHPLEKWVMESIRVLGYKYPQDVRPVSSEADFLFAENFFNKSYFSPSASEDKRQLGEYLFYDKQLSANGMRSCATCHVPDKGFADGMVKNTVIGGTESLLRNTPTLLNAGFQTKQFYDSRAGNLEKQSWDVIHNQLEMGGNMSVILSGLKQNQQYKILFEKAYPKGEINQNNLLNSIAVYVASLTSLNSSFDRYLRGENVSLSEEVKEGFNLFTGKAKCATCHFMPLFNGLVPPYYSDTESEIIGVPKHKSAPSVIDPDHGRYNYTRLDLHRYAFKTSSVRNVELTAPYMHNGAFETLEELMDFYNNGGGAGQNMDLDSQTLSPDSLKLTPAEIRYVIRFMKSLTDNQVGTMKAH